MSVQLPPNSSGSVVDTFTTTASKERQVFIHPYGGQFSVVSTPAAASQATATQASAGTGNKNVATKVSFSIATGSNAQTAITINLRDGATGAGTILWSKTIILPSTSFWSENVDLELYGSNATAMTLEFSAAGVALSYQSVTLIGFTTA